MEAKIVHWQTESKVVRIKTGLHILTVTKIADGIARIWMRVDNPLNSDGAKVMATGLTLAAKVARCLDELTPMAAHDTITKAAKGEPCNGSHSQ